jgi:hypothetical protein
VPNPEVEEKVRALVDMGFPEDQVRAALAAAFNNQERAVEYLMTGIPEVRLPVSRSCRGRHVIVMTAVVVTAVVVTAGSVIVTMVVVALRCHRASTLASVAHRVPWRRPLLPLRPLLRLVVATRWHPCARTRRSIRCGVMCDVLLVSCCGFLL